MELTELIKCLGKPEKMTLLDYSWIGLSPVERNVARAKLIANPTRVTTERISIVSCNV
jgi:hypothetical protein